MSGSRAAGSIAANGNGLPAFELRDAAFSTTLAGFVIVIGGYSTAFLVLAAIALAALLVFLFFMPETKPGEEPVPAKAGERQDPRGSHAP